MSSLDKYFFRIKQPFCSTVDMQTLPYMSNFILLCICIDLNEQGILMITLEQLGTFQCWQGNFIKIQRQELHSWKTSIILRGTQQVFPPSQILCNSDLSNYLGKHIQYTHPCYKMTGYSHDASCSYLLLCLKQCFLSLRPCVWGRLSLCFPRSGEVYTVWS